MGKNEKKLIIALILTAALSQSVNAESLFKTGISQSDYAVNPRSLYSAVSARAVGDLITILIDEQVTSSDELSFATNKESSTTDNFSTLLNKILPGKPINGELDSYGGSNEISNAAKVSRKMSIQNTITAQVMQVLPNGTFVVQGKKTAINSGETVNIIISGIVDPRFVNKLGQINSSKIANFQMAISGKGAVSRSNQDGPVNKFIRYLF